MNADELSALMNDHLAGAVAAITLLKDYRERLDGGEGDELLARIIPEIEQDRDALKRMISDLEFKPSKAKQAVGWLSETFIEARINAIRTRNSAAGLLFLLEALLMGIYSKQLLWEALQAIQDDLPALAGYDYAHLIERAKQQREPLRKHHAALAQAAFIQTPVQ